LYKFPDGFDPDMAYQLKERAPQTLADAQNIAVTVEANLIAKRNRARAERRTTFKEEPSAFDQKLDAIINGLQRLGERVENVERKSSWEGQQSNTIRNPNFRKTQNVTAGRSNLDHDIRPPFQDNYVEGSTSSQPTEDSHMNLMDLKGEHQTFLTQEDQDEHDCSQFHTKTGESFDFKQGYDTVVYEVHKQYKLRTRTIDISEPSKPKEGKQPNRIKNRAVVAEPADTIVPNPEQVTVEDITDMQPSVHQPLPPFSSEQNSKNVPKNFLETVKSQANTSHNADKQQQIADNSNEKEKTASINTKTPLEKSFNLEAEIGKLKIVVPLSELAKHDVYRQQIQRSLQLPENKDDVNVLDDSPELLFGPEANGKTTQGPVPPFYISLHVHDRILHNAMFDSGASHNLMPKAVMEKLNLDITRPYKDLYSFDSSQVKCLGLIKDLCVSLVQYPNKTILMDVVVADIPPKYGMLLSRSWGAKLQGSLQLDLSYATISVFGQPKRLYRETLMKYVVSSESKPENFPIYSIHSDMDSFILFNDDMNYPTNCDTLALEQQIHINEESVAHPDETVTTVNTTSTLEEPHQTEVSNLPNPKTTETLSHTHQQEITWYLEFDGSVNKLGAGVGVWIHNTHDNHAEGHAYRLNLKCTNNMAEYEALLLGLKLLKTLGAAKVSILGDSDLIIQQMKGNFVTNDNRMRVYRTAATNILNAFTEFNLAKISRSHNIHAHSLATFASTCKLLLDQTITSQLK